MTLNTKELRKYHVIRNTILKCLTNSKAGTILSLSIRQIQRLKRRVEIYGPQGVVHCLTSKPGNHRKKS